MPRRRSPEIATVHAVAHDGRGIAAIDGKKVFVPGVLPGEQVRIVRHRIRRGYDEAELLDVLLPSPQRVTPRCAAFGVCGGCTFQHVTLDDQRLVKQKALRDNLERIGGISPERWLEPLFDPACEGAWHYRRRARLAIRDVPGKKRVLVGFREQRTSLIADMHSCETLVMPLARLIDPLSELVGSLSLRKRLPQIEVAAGDNATELVFRVLDRPTPEDRALLCAFARKHGLRLSLQHSGAELLETLWPEGSLDPLFYQLPQFGLDITFEPLDFIQVNGPVNRLMVSAALDLLQLRQEDNVLDLYCGVGNFSLPAARRAAQVLGIEGEAAQVARAQSNASRNRVDNCKFRCADLANITGREPWLRQAWNKVLIDPPRSGAGGAVAAMKVLRPDRIVYVSCHPATLARDARVLTGEQGYRLEAAGIVDMFPHTAHAEAIAVFQASSRHSA